MIRLPRDSKVMYIFVDESGDIGFGKKSSKHLVIALFVPKDLRSIRKCFKKIRRRKLKKRYSAVNEFKWNKSSASIRKLVLSKLAEREFDIYYIVCVKSKVYDYLKDHKNELQTYLTGIIAEQIVAKPDDKKLRFVIDKFLSKEGREEYNRYIEEKIKGSFATGKEISIEHLDSASEPNLQAADMIAGAIFQKYEKGDNSYYDIVKGHIKKEDIRWK